VTGLIVLTVRSSIQPKPKLKVKLEMGASRGILSPCGNVSPPDFIDLQKKLN